MRLRSRRSGSNGESGSSLKKGVLYFRHRTAVGEAMKGIQGTPLESATTPTKGMILVLGKHPHMNTRRQEDIFVDVDFLRIIKKNLRRVARKKKTYDLVFIDEETKNEFEIKNQKVASLCTNRLYYIDGIEDVLIKTAQEQETKLFAEIDPAAYGDICVEEYAQLVDGQTCYHEGKEEDYDEEIIANLMINQALLKDENKKEEEDERREYKEKKEQENVKHRQEGYDEKERGEEKNEAEVIQRSHYLQELEGIGKEGKDWKHAFDNTIISDELISLTVLTDKIIEEFEQLGKRDVTIIEYILMAKYCAFSINESNKKMKKNDTTLLEMKKVNS